MMNFSNLYPIIIHIQRPEIELHRCFERDQLMLLHITLLNVSKELAHGLYRSAYFEQEFQRLKHIQKYQYQKNVF